VIGIGGQGEGAFAEGDGVGGAVNLLLELGAFGDGVVHTLLHEAAVIMVPVGHVVSGRGRLLSLLLLRGASSDE
jgi:hypothetical protein